MTQRDLDDQVALLTGESPATFRRMGFVPLTGVPFEREPLALDWDSQEPAGLSDWDDQSSDEFAD